MDIELQIDIATKQDLNRIVEIYNWAIQNTSVTFDTDSKTIQSQLGWFESHDKNIQSLLLGKMGAFSLGVQLVLGLIDVLTLGQEKFHFM
jgi:phosphinothricin acetyltransferase